MSNESKAKKVAKKSDENIVKNTEIEKAIARNDEEWIKRMLLLVMTMIIALLGID